MSAPMPIPQSSEMWRSGLRTVRTYVSNSFSIPTKKLPRVLFHAVLLSVVVAGFWLLDSLKDPVLARIVGIEYQPAAKMVSVATTLLVTCVYDYLTSRLSKANLFHVVSAVFGLVLMVLSAQLASPDSGLRSSLEPGPHRLLGWCAYVTIEAYGSLMVALFWSFTNSVMDLEEAKGAYGLIISLAQVGAISGSTLATNSKSIGISVLFLAGAMSVFCVSLLVKVYHIIHRPRWSRQPQHGYGRASRAALDAQQWRRTRAASVDEYDELVVPPAASPSASSSAALSSAEGAAAAVGGERGGGPLSAFSEGLFLIINDRYLLLLFGVTCLHEVVITLMDYQFKILGAADSARSAAEHAVGAVVAEGAEEDTFANLLGHFGQATNLFSFVVSFFGFSYLVTHFGVRNSLMIFPCVLFMCVVVTNLEPSFSVLFVCVSVAKALVFSLHDPVKELLYIPTSAAVKFKAKAWIDVFGSRIAKAAGSLLSFTAHGDVVVLRAISEVPCLLLSLGMVALAFTAGNEFERKVSDMNQQKQQRQQQQETIGD